jgi:hypothetical protein
MKPEWISALATATAAIVSIVSLFQSIATEKRLKILEKNIQNIGGSAVANTGNGVVNIIGQTTGGSALLSVSKKNDRQ